MGLLTGTAIIDKALFTLQDTGVRWTRAELLGYLNDGQGDICLIKPDAYSLNGAVQLIAGTKQTLPAGSTIFVRIARNMGAAGTMPGRAPRYVPLATKDLQTPNWHSEASSATVMEYSFEPKDPQHYYVSPPQPATGQGYVDLVRHAMPAALAAEANTIIIGDEYATTLMHYMAYRAYLRDGELGDANLAAQHRATFIALLGAKEKGQDDAKAAA